MMFWKVSFQTAALTAVAAMASAVEPASQEALPYGLTKRVPWTTSNFRGRPEPPPPYKAERLYSNLRFEKTTLIATAPGTDWIFVGERAGKIYALPPDRDATEATVFLDTAALMDQVSAERKAPVNYDSLYGLTFDPDFKNNRYCYICYVVRLSDRKAGPDQNGTRVSRFRVSKTDPPVCDPASEQLIISWLQGGHNGGCVKFGPDGYLYISSGDGGVAFPPDGLNSGQDMTRLLSKVLRIDVRQPQDGRPYTIPADNPFVNQGDFRGETWAYGLRNPWKMSFDRKTGDLWVGDVGWELWELVFRVNKGDNFGWSIVEGSQPVHPDRERGPTPIVPPTMEIPHTDGASITGGFVYRGKKFPELEGSYVFGDWETRRIWGAKVEDGKLGERYELIDPTIRIVDFAEDKDGELYLLDHYDGSIFTLARNEMKADANPFPRKLSETGLFQSVAKHEPAPGVLPFSVNVEQWSDHATAERLVAVPGSESIQNYPKARPVPGSQFSRATDYPKDTVLLKTFSLEVVDGDKSSRKRIETQALHFDGLDWLGYTYEWNDEQTDAVLVDRAGKSRTIAVADSHAPGGKRSQTWRFSSRNDCLRCHNPWSEYALGFNLKQLNRPHDYGGVTDNQIRTLRHIGLLVSAIPEPNPKRPTAKLEPLGSHETLPKLTPAFDPSADINERARSYLHVNCGHCHRYNGGGSSYVFLQHEISLAAMKAVGVRPTQGTFGIPDAQLIAAGDPYRSTLYFRMSKTGPGHMPHLGTTVIDDQGLKLIHDWIKQLQPPTGEDLVQSEPSLAASDVSKIDQLVDLQNATGAKAEERLKLTAELLASPPKAMLLADAVRQRRLKDAARASVLEVALKSDVDPAIRDLFEAFLPEEQRTRRLGETIDPAEILSLVGDESRGRQLFHESTVVQCRSCHRIDGKGTALGPDLDSIGKKYDRTKLLQSILQPSLEVDPKFTLWLVQTNDGTIVSGLLAQRDATAVVLKDAQNKTHRVASGDIEQMVAQKKSQMPDALLRDFTAQQAADLLAYLASLKAEPGAGAGDTKKD